MKFKCSKINNLIMSPMTEIKFRIAEGLKRENLKDQLQSLNIV